MHTYVILLLAGPSIPLIPEFDTRANNDYLAHLS